MQETSNNLNKLTLLIACSTLALHLKKKVQ